MVTDTDIESLTYGELFEKLLLTEDIILESIPAYQDKEIRKGIAVFKTKMNAKLKRNDLPVETRRVEYDILEKRENGTIKLRIFFAHKQRINTKIIISEGLGNES